MTDCGGALRRIEFDGPLLKSIKFTYILRAKIHEHPSVMWRREEEEEREGAGSNRLFIVTVVGFHIFCFIN